MKALELLTPEDILSLWHTLGSSFVFKQHGRFENLDGTYNDYSEFPKDKDSCLAWFDNKLEAMIYRNFINGHTKHKAILIADMAAEDDGYCVLIELPYKDFIIKDKKGNILKNNT